MRQRRSLFAGRGRIQAQSPMTWTAASLAKHAAASIQSPFKVFCSLQSAFGRASRSLFIHRRLPQPRRRCRRKPKSENRTRRRPRQPRPPQRRHRQHAVRQRWPSSRSSKPRRQCTPRPRISARYMRRAALAAPERLAAPLPPQPRMAAAAPQTPPLWMAGRLPDLMEGSAAARAHAAMLERSGVWLMMRPTLSKRRCCRDNNTEFRSKRELSNKRGLREVRPVRKP